MSIIERPTDLQQYVCQIEDCQMWHMPHQHASGYWSVRCCGHPLANEQTQRAWYHRVLLYDAIGPGPHTCVWCGCPIEWFGKGEHKLNVDHLDGDPGNNSIENLYESDPICNANRGDRPWVVVNRRIKYMRGEV